LLLVLDWLNNVLAAAGLITSTLLLSAIIDVLAGCHAAPIPNNPREPILKPAIVLVSQTQLHQILHIIECILNGLCVFQVQYILVEPEIITLWCVNR
jgi:hypothetical protein